VAAVRLPRCTNSGHVGGADLVAAFVRLQQPATGGSCCNRWLLRTRSSSAASPGETTAFASNPAVCAEAVGARGIVLGSVLEAVLALAVPALQKPDRHGRAPRSRSELSRNHTGELVGGWISRGRTGS
jgi:hypothetical protein